MRVRGRARDRWVADCCRITRLTIDVSLEINLVARGQKPWKMAAGTTRRTSHANLFAMLVSHFGPEPPTLFLQGTRLSNIVFNHIQYYPWNGSLHTYCLRSTERIGQGPIGGKSQLQWFAPFSCYAYRLISECRPWATVHIFHHPNKADHRGNPLRSSRKPHTST
jgi:hypothetical protein